MGMSLPLPEPGDRRYVRHSREYLLSQSWTADRVRHELIDERWAAPRYEFLDGELLVSPSPEPLHQHAIVQLVAILLPYVEGNRVGAVLCSPSDVELASNNTAQPDVFVLPQLEARRVLRRGVRIIHSLLLAVEVLSPSTAGYDRIKKRAHYRKHGTPEYWVVDLDARCIEVSRPEDARVEVYDETLTWQPPGAATPLVLDVADYFARVLAPRGIDEPPAPDANGADGPEDGATSRR